jgi:hypothetical protein
LVLRSGSDIHRFRWLSGAYLIGRSSLLIDIAIAPLLVPTEIELGLLLPSAAFLGWHRLLWSRCVTSLCLLVDLWFVMGTTRCFTKEICFSNFQEPAGGRIPPEQNVLVVPGC